MIADLENQIKDCRLCVDRFKATATGHSPRPVFWGSDQARILIAGQAPGARVHQSGKPFDDPSGDRLRDWLDVTKDEFYDRDRFAIVPMAFCFPGYDAKGSDLPPPKLCAKTWHEQVMAAMPQIELTILIGGHAFAWHLGKPRVTETVLAWRDHAPTCFPLPHPSWRNTAWLKKNPWFEAELIPVLRQEVKKWK